MNQNPLSVYCNCDSVDVSTVCLYWQSVEKKSASIFEQLRSLVVKGIVLHLYSVDAHMFSIRRWNFLSVNEGDLCGSMALPPPTSLLFCPAGLK